MARVLQDGFETEGKEYDKSYISKPSSYKLDIAELTCVTTSTGLSYLKIKSGVTAPRGGYGRKGYSVEPFNDRTIAVTCALKYDLTKYCSDTSELFYRVWINPHLTSTVSSAAESRVCPIVITDIEIEKNINVSTFNYNKFLESCNCVITTEQIDLETYLLNCYCNGVLVYSYNFLSYDQWVKVDVRLKVGDANNGIFQLRINDKLITTFNGHTGTMNPKYLYIGKAFTSNMCYCKFDIDDIAVNDTTGNVNNSWCGNGSIIGITPSANGSKTMFTPGVEGTQNFENVDELQPDGDVTYNSSYALNDVDLFKFTIPEELEIPPTETINAISLTTSAKFVEQPTDIGHLVSDGTTETLVGQHSISNDYTQQSSIIQEKSDGTKYKVSDIEGLEFGYKTLESAQPQEE